MEVSAFPKMGLSLLNEQHDMLKGQMHSVVEALDQKEAAGVVAKRLGDLIRYVDLHFSMEEEVMASNDYPRLALHKSAHEAFRNKVRQLHESVDGSNTEIMEVLVRLLERWLENHEAGEDERLLEFMKS
ncbi:MAG: hypothetical protein DRJ42_23260 [Deltaproteobacteria bacterium]|nr:MAG: hypothetical protein DRJ42_23260 [Deltaproteobacteria bacterium]